MQHREGRVGLVGRLAEDAPDGGDVEGAGGRDDEEDREHVRQQDQPYQVRNGNTTAGVLLKRARDSTATATNAMTADSWLTRMQAPSTTPRISAGRRPGPTQPDRGLDGQRQEHGARDDVQVGPVLLGQHRGQPEERARRDRPGLGCSHSRAHRYIA